LWHSKKPFHSVDWLNQEQLYCDRIQQNQELLASRHFAEAEQQRYQQLFEFAPDAYLVTDLHGVIQEANKAASLLFKVPQPFLIGKSVISFVVEEQRHSFRTLLNQLSAIERVQE
jgi:PAS domain-containing protein